VETVSLKNGYVGQYSYWHAGDIDLLALVVAVVVSKLHGRRVRAFLHDPHPHRAGCAARLFSTCAYS
jgi:hypothetical protein